MPNMRPRRRTGGPSCTVSFSPTAARVCAALVQPAKLEQWFVVPGYVTPADRIPLGLEYAEVNLPHGVVIQQPTIRPTSHVWGARSPRTGELLWTSAD